MAGKGKRLVPRLNLQLEGLSTAISNESPRNYAPKSSRKGSTSIPTPRTQTNDDQRSGIGSQLPLPTPRGGFSYAQALATPRGGAPPSSSRALPPPQQPVIVAFTGPTSQPSSIPTQPPPHQQQHHSISTHLSHLHQEEEEATIHSQTKLQTTIETQQAELQSRLASISDLAKTRDQLAAQVAHMQQLCHQAAGVEEILRGESVALRLLVTSLQATLDIHKQQNRHGCNSNSNNSSRESTRSALIALMTVAARQLELPEIEKVLVSGSGGDVPPIKSSSSSSDYSVDNKKHHRNPPSARLSQQFIKASKDITSDESLIVIKRLDSIHDKLEEVENVLVGRTATTAVGEGALMMMTAGV